MGSETVVAGKALPQKIVSGGQTGVDRAALDVALELGLPCGGWCPRGRLAEDGPIAERYPLQETESADYAERTRLNVRDSGGTLVLTRGRPEGGTALTLRLARAMRRPLMVVHMGRGAAAHGVRAWIEAKGIATLHVAGPRESTVPGIHAEAAAFMKELLGVSPPQP